MARFNDRLYQASHGKAPKGRGQWMFEVERRVETAQGFQTEVITVSTPHTMTFTDARRWTRHRYETRNVYEFRVIP